MTLATRIGVMNRGEIVQIGTPREIYEYPTSRFVADFIGSVNLFDGDMIEDEPDRVRIACADLPAPVCIDHGVSAAPHARLWVAIRPEKIALTRDAPGTPDNWARGTVTGISYRGDLSIYVLTLPGGREVRVTQTNLTRNGEERFTWDDEVYLSWDGSSPVVGTG